MSVTDPFKPGLGSESQIKLTENNLAPHHALKVALQAMKDRCTKLQTRISRLEEENLQLRIGKFKMSEPTKSDTQDITILQKKIEELLGNKEFWEKFSSINEENTSAVQNLNNYTQNFKKNSNEMSPITKNKGSKGISKDDSLEEVSLKVLHSIVRSKSNLGEPHSLEVQNENELMSLDEEEMESDKDCESLEESLNTVLKNIKRERDLARSQQEGLKSALHLFKTLIKENMGCKVCQQKAEESKQRLVENKIVGTEESLRMEELYGNRNKVRGRALEAELQDRICPLCEEYFHCTTPFDTFNEHVLSHFVEADDENDDNFELIE